MTNQVVIPPSQMAVWLDRWAGNHMSWQIQREIDAEILGVLTGSPEHKLHILEPPDQDFWLTDEQKSWCETQNIQLTVSLEVDPKRIVFIFQTPEQATQFAVTWL